MAKIIVTGGAGFIGSHIVDRLMAGNEVHVIDNLSSGLVENVPAGAKLHKLDIRSAEAAALVQSIKPDVLVHAAAQISVRISMDQPALDTDINVTGLINLLTPLCNSKGTHVVFLSSGGACYGEQEVFPAPESHPIRPESVYGLSKRVGEMYLEFWSRVWGVTSTSLRLSNVYGPRQNPHGEAGVVAIFCERLLAGKDITVNGSGEQTRDFVYVEDVAEAVFRAVETRATGEYNIGTGEETSVISLAENLRERACPSAKISFAPAKAGEQMRSVIDNGLAARKLSWRPKVGMAVGLDRTLAWYRQGNR
ncbi:MAG: NAD-dependent epimerase/dehydratase family protein [Pseudomonadota bacterium]|jgi:UDP-glucose 4-epimerase